MRLIFCIAILMLGNLVAQEDSPTSSEPLVYTTSMVLQDYQKLMSLVDDPNRPQEQLVQALMDMLNKREFIDREVLVCMHSLLPKEFYALVLDYQGDPDAVFPSYSLKSSTQYFTHTFDRRTHKVLNVQELSLWEQDALRKFVQDNYQFLIYHVTSLNHLDRDVLNLDGYEFSRIITPMGVNKTYLRQSILKLSNLACQGRLNFNKNLRNNLTAFGIPVYLWNEDIESSLSLGNRDWVHALCNEFIRTTQLILCDSVDLSRMEEKNMLYCYFIFLYRAQSYSSMAATLIGQVSELYSGLAKTESAYYKRREELKVLNASLNIMSTEIEELKEEYKQFQQAKHKVDQSITKTQKEIDQLERKIKEFEAKIKELRQQSAQHPDKMKIHQRLLDDKAKESQDLADDLKELAEGLDKLKSQIQELRQREDHREEYVKASAVLRELSAQRDQLHGIYEVFAQNSGQERLRLENARLKAENSALDAEIARLEAELAEG